MSSWLLISLTAVVACLATLAIDFIVRQFGKREKHVERKIEHLYAAGDDQFVRTMANLLTGPFREGNRITPLRNGDEIFPAMLAAIRGARSTITFETFIYWAGDIGGEFAQALAERARAGVKVHVLLDWFGSKELDLASIQMMEDAGVELQRYHKLHFTRFRTINHRTHRKLLIVDGSIGFTGGVGIADEWTGNAQDADHWRDSHYRIEGPCVAALQSAFMDNWIKASGVVLHDERYFPALEHHAGDAACQVFASSPAAGADSVRLMFLLAITAACKSIRIGTAYFVPDELSTGALQAARRRGVEIEIIVPGEHNDEGLVRLASRSQYGKLLRVGIRIYEYQPTMYHTKLMIVDDLWVSVGSTNFDNRSFSLNDEINLNALDRELARSQTEWFEHDKAHSKEMKLNDWARRPIHEKLREHLVSWLHSQL
ncbi:MAG: cardiolipin synthase [Gammaproteobacteria bacterium]|nr:cardiolipin synthase [Gammaproteobacteria bacterium]